MIQPKKTIKNLYREGPIFTNRVGNITRLDRNERTTPFPEEHLKEILKKITPDEVSAYPELEPIYVKLAHWLKVDRDNLLLTTGADTGIRSVYEVYVSEGDEVITLTPTYAMFPVYCDMFGALKKEIHYDLNFNLPVKRILDAITPKTKLIAIANPNHTGTEIPESELLKILDSAKHNGTVVLIDETYYHFYLGTLQPFIEKYENLVISRTFSKAFGIAGLRVGYLISNKNIISELYKVKLTYEITSISAKFIDYLLDHLEIMEKMVNDVNQGKAYLLKEFKNLGLQAPESCTNFILVKLPDKFEGENIVSALYQKGFAIKGPFSSGLLKGYVRITAGPVAQMETLMANFIQIFQGLKNKQ